MSGPTSAAANVGTHAVITPAGVEELAAVVRESTDGLRIRGAGTWLEAGHPVHAAHELRLDAFAGVRAYVPADLTISVGAVTTLAELNAVTHAHGQWCPLLPWGDDRATIGAVIATATAGPAAAALGRPRDLVLGLECVDGLGRVIQAGGRVVKNVAGFDLTRLMTGSWGTLGVITEVHLRLRARPAVDETWRVTPLSDSSLEAFVRGPYAPLALHREEESLLVRLGGNSAFVAAARSALQSLGASAEVSAAEWDRVRLSAGPEATAMRWRWDTLSRQLKERFDPRNQLNPGLLGASA
jgi:glycolate oxidase FAD binding subunit